MKITTTLMAAAVCMAGALSAHAATFNITGAVNDSINGFGSSGFHKQTSNNGMSGAYFDKFDAASVTGQYESDTSLVDNFNIFFSGDMIDKGSFTAKGLLEESMTRTGGLFGSIIFEITGTMIAGLDGTHKFTFADEEFNDEANGIFNGTQISLWGDNGIFGTTKDGLKVGLDVRLTINPTDDPFNEPEPVPLPATAFLLLGALGGIGGLRKLRKKS